MAYPGHETSTVDLMVDDLHRSRRVDHRTKALIRQILSLNEQRHALHRTGLEVVADLSVDDRFRDGLTPGRSATETGEVAEEARAIAHAATGVETPFLEEQRAVHHPLRISRNGDAVSVHVLDL